MYRLMVLYPHPKDPEHFRNHYENVHIPLARKLPNLISMSYGFNLQGQGEESPYFCVWQGNFESAEKMAEAMQSEAGQAVENDVPNYATGGAIVVHYEVHE